MPPATLDSHLLQAALISPDSFATTLLVILVDEYGTECFQWSPETIRLEIEEDFKLKLPQPNFDRLMAAINIITSDDFYQSLPDFVTYCNILAGDTFDPRAWDPADAAEIAWGITEVLLLSPPDAHDENPFSEEIVGYIGQALSQEGIITPPDVLKIAVRDKDPAMMVVSEYADDPEMFNSIYDLEQSKTGEINRLVKTGLQSLIQQLQPLPLRNGDAAGGVRQLLQTLPTEPSEI